MKEWVQAITGLSGVVGDSARGQISRGTWETRRGGVSQRLGGIHNPSGGLVSGVGPAHISREAGNDRGAKGSGRKHVEVRGRECRLDASPPTEEPAARLGNHSHLRPWLCCSAKLARFD